MLIWRHIKITQKTLNVIKCN